MGFIYILTNELFGENIYKIGITKNLKSRLCTYNTCVPNKSSFCFTKSVCEKHLRKIETEVFDRLNEFKLPEKKEFFDIDIKVAIGTINEVSSKYDINEIEPLKENKILSSFLKNIDTHNKDTTYDLLCEYCHRTFNSNNNNRKHLKLCKNINDSVCILERKLNLPVFIPQDISCRFCQQKYTCSSGLSRHKSRGCSKKDEYEAHLRKLIESQENQN